jgi:mannose-6-phosphate isomerase-like protein (cupin superfamily)
MAVSADRVLVRILSLAHGDWNEPRCAVADTVLVGVRGTVEFAIDSASYTVGPFDILAIPHGTTFRCGNRTSPALLFQGIDIGGATGGTEADTSADHIRWEDSRSSFRWDRPGADQPGLHRGSGPHFRSQTLRGHLISFPGGQGSPLISNPRDIVFLVLDGELEFHVGGATWTVRPWDLLLVTEGTRYLCRNVSRSDAILFDVGGMPPPGRSTTYH